MKNTNYIINGILAVAVIILFILHFTGKKGSGGEPLAITGGDSTSVSLPVAYINTDTLLLNYNFAKDLNDGLMRKIESSRANIGQKTQQLQAEILDFRKKLENNAFLSRERAEQEEARLAKKEQELREHMSRTQNEFDMEQMKVNQQLSDTVITILKDYNQAKKYQIIFSNAGKDNILLANDAYDITTEVLEYLNKRYTPIEK